jgi:hypothetical protein
LTLSLKKFPPFVKKITSSIKDMRKRSPFLYIAAIEKTLWKFLKMTYHMIQQSYYWIHIKGNEISTLKGYLHSHAYCGTIHDSQDKETAYMSITRWMNKENVYIFTSEHYLTIKRMSDHDCKWNKSGTEDKYTWPHSYVESKKLASQRLSEEWWLPEPWKSRKEKRLFMGTKLHLGRSKKSGVILYYKATSYK